MTRLYRPWNTPFVAQPCALGEAIDGAYKPGDSFEATRRRVVIVDGWRHVKHCLNCGDEYPPNGGYGEPGLDFCTQVCHDAAARRGDV